MNLFFAILANIGVLATPYLILFIILGFWASKRNITTKTLINKYSKVKDLFGITLGMQCLFLVATVMGLIVTAITDHANIGPLADVLFVLAIMTGILELCFGIPILVDAGIDANYAIKKTPSNQPIKF